jgi:mono/diheme cytochrome c family protein
MRRLLILPLAALAATGCGSANTTPREVFQGACGNCHTLKAAGTHGDIGPNLDELKPSIATVKNQIASGGKGMPSGLVSGPKAEQVAAYVANSAGN